MVKIRQATIEDAKQIEMMYLKKVQQLANKGIVQWEREEVLWEQLSKEYAVEEFYLVTADDQFVGAFVLVDFDPTYWKNDAPKQCLYIHKVMVLDEAEKSGVSKHILDFFKEESKRRGFLVAKLDVREHKSKLRAYYERNGFVLHEIVDLGMGYLTCLYTWS